MDNLVVFNDIIKKNNSLLPSEFEKIDKLIDQSFVNAGIVKMGDQNIEEYKENLKLTPFNEGSFSKKNFLKGEQKTPHRIFRQIMMQLDGRLHTWLQHKEKHVQTEIELRKMLLQIKKLEKLNNDKISADIIETRAAKLKVDDLTKEDFKIDEATKDKIKEELIKVNSSSYDSNTFDDIDASYYELEVLEIESKIREMRYGQAQTAKLIKDTAIEIEVLQKERDKFKPFVDKLESNGVSFEDAENVYWNRRFGENCKIKQFVNSPILNIVDDNNQPVMENDIKYLIDDSVLREKRQNNQELIEGTDFVVIGQRPKQIYFEKAKDLDPEQIRAIIQTPKKTREKIFSSLSLPPNLKEILKIENDEDDTLENIVNHYKSWLDASKEHKDNSNFQASGY